MTELNENDLNISQNATKLLVDFAILPNIIVFTHYLNRQNITHFVVYSDAFKRTNIYYLKISNQSNQHFLRLISIANDIRSKSLEYLSELGPEVMAIFSRSYEEQTNKETIGLIIVFRKSQSILCCYTHYQILSPNVSVFCTKDLVLWISFDLICLVQTRELESIDWLRDKC